MSSQITVDVVNTAAAVLSEVLESYVIIGLPLERAEAEMPAIYIKGEVEDCRKMAEWAGKYIPELVAG